MSQPAAVSSAICCSVALTSAVSVVVIDCTETGASLPTPTLPTLIWRVLRRGASTGGGAAGMPRLIAVMTVHSRRDVRRPRVATCQLRRIGATMSATISTTLITRMTPAIDVGDRQQLGDVDVAGVGPAAQPGDAAAHRLVEGAGDVAAVERQQRDEVEQRRGTG